MSKIVPVKDIGVPVPSPAPDPTLHLIVYCGPKGFTPAYTPVAPNGRFDLGPLSGLTQKTVSNVTYYDTQIGNVLPTTLAVGDYDFYFTFMVAASTSESDFSPVIDVLVDEVVPSPPGQPVTF